eukprot:m.269155 g.269155  ORF g.269155 m.269155 type:complete len:1204 (-) comp22819_c1_seq1:21-3632(-)
MSRAKSLIAQFNQQAEVPAASTSTSTTPPPRSPRKVTVAAFGEAVPKQQPSPATAPTPVPAAAPEPAPAPAAVPAPAEPEPGAFAPAAAVSARQSQRLSSVGDDGGSSDTDETQEMPVPPASEPPSEPTVPEVPTAAEPMKQPGEEQQAPEQQPALATDASPSDDNHEDAAAARHVPTEFMTVRRFGSSSGILKTPEKKKEIALERQNSTVSDKLRRSVSWSVDVRAHSKDKSDIVVDAESCVKVISEGCLLAKVRGKKLYPRWFAYDPVACQFTWKSERSSKPRAVPIASITEVRSGKNSPSFRYHKHDAYPKDQCFSVKYGQDNHLLELIAEDAVSASAWVMALRHLAKRVLFPTPWQGVTPAVTFHEKRDLWLRSTFASFDTNQDGVLSEKEILSAMKKLNVRMSERVVLEKYRFHLDYKARGYPSLSEMQADKADRMNFEEFCAFYKSLSMRQELFLLLSQYSVPGSEAMDCAGLRRFLEIEQGMVSVTEEDCKRLIQTYELSDAGKDLTLLGLEGFTNMLLSKCLAFDGSHLVDPMTHPINEYYISSSHNTYLLEDQLKGPSSTEAYVNAFAKGCKCVEVDVWDGPEGPIVYHGYTLTSRIDLKPVLQTIRDHGFAVSPYPVVISLENHCSLEQQRMMAAMFRDVFGKLLYTTPMPEDGRMPSPEDLRGRFIIKGRKLPPNVAEDGDVSEEDESAPNDKRKKKKNMQKKGMKNQDDDAHEKKFKLSKELSDMICMFVSKQIKSWEDHDNRPWYIRSVDESKGLKYYDLDPSDFLAYTRRQLVRIYPAGVHVNSENFDPQPFWNVGCQVVALNFQTCDQYMYTYMGKFRANNRAGYLLKPLEQRERIDDLNPRSQSKSSIARHLTITVISAQSLPKPTGTIMRKSEIVDPFVVVGISGLDGDCVAASTKVIDNNGFHPTWDETFRFTVSAVDRAVIYFTVLDEDTVGEDFLAQYACPLAGLQQGYRHVQLENKEGNPIPQATLFLRVAWTDKPTVETMTLRKSVKRMSGTLQLLQVTAIDDIVSDINNARAQAQEMFQVHKAAVRAFAYVVGTSDLVEGVTKITTRCVDGGNPDALHLVSNGKLFKIEMPDIDRHRDALAFNSLADAANELMERIPPLVAKVEAHLPDLEHKLEELQVGRMELDKQLSIKQLNKCVKNGLINMNMARTLTGQWKATCDAVEAEFLTVKNVVSDRRREAI